VNKVVGKRLFLGLCVHRTKLLTELVSDRGRGALVSVQEAGSGCGLPLVSLAHAWELLSPSSSPRGEAIIIAEFKDTVSD
jgi:hypothetical protein